MSSPIVEVHALSKRYKLGRVSATSLRDEAERWWNRLRNRASQTSDEKDLWALRDVSFNVQPGEVLGIIGKNGAGKSTLLKILSRITEPTKGEAILRGRVASLLEIGTGFHPELTGRENVYLSGTILGMKKREIEERFDEIVGFAEMERHIDTPVKRYSSGQYVRLGFAVAAHLEAEVLIVDEVLAVGDARFQNRCLRKMGNIAEYGRTVLIVSHNLPLMQALCHRMLLLKDGNKIADGDSEEVISIYAGGLAEGRGRFQPKEAVNQEFQLRLRLENLALVKNDRSDHLILDVEVELQKPMAGLAFGFKLLGPSGELVSALPDSLTRFNLPAEAGTVRCKLTIPEITRRLNGGLYRLDCWLALTGSEYLIRMEEAGFFELPNLDRFGHGVGMDARRFGFPVIDAKWECAERR